MLARFERLMEQAVEGSLRRVFPASLQPIQLAKAAARAMEQGSLIGVRGAEVPNVYELRLSQADFERFEPQRELLIAEIGTYLVEYAHERELRPVAAIRVELESDAGVREGTVRAGARFGDLTPEVQQGIDKAVEGTRRLRLADLAAAQPRPKPTGGLLTLSYGADLDFALDPQIGVVRLGRATDNDVVVDSQRVSRYHAQLRWVESCWLVYDLESTNGTWVGDRRIAAGQPLALDGGARLRLGDYELVVRANGAARGPD